MNTPDAIRRKVLAWLAQRDYAPGELVQKLKQKKVAEVDIHPVLVELVAAGFIQEERFIENFIRWRRDRGYGPLRIRQELLARGIRDENIADHLNITDNAWFIQAKRVWQKQFKNRIATDFRERAKQMRFLQYRGFTREHIEQALEITQLEE